MKLKCTVLLPLFLLFSLTGWNQTIPWTENFTTPTYTVTLGGEGEDGTHDYFMTTDSSGINISYIGSEGNFFAGQDIDDGGWVGSESPSQLTWTNINISGCADLQISCDFASVATEKIDGSDYLLLEYKIDDGDWIKVIAFENDGTTHNTYFLEDTDFDGIGEGVQLTSTFQTFAKNITVSGSNISLRFTAAADSGEEDFAIDNLSVCEAPASPEPSSHVAEFSATANNYDTIELSWIEIDGLQPAEGYLIKASTADNITNPTDGNVVADNATIGDNSGAKNIASANSSYQWSGLTSGATYYFKIFPYTNQNSEIDYKTNGEVPTTGSTTSPTSGTGSVFVSELADPKEDFRPNRYIEIYNAGDSFVDLTGWSVVAVGNGNDIHTWTLSGTIAAGEAKTCGDDENIAFTPDFADVDWSGDNTSWNGTSNAGGDGAKLLNAAKAIIDDASNHGDFADKSSIRRLSVKTGSTTFNSSNWQNATITTLSDASPGSHVIIWDGSVDNDWGVAENWKGDVIPNKLNHVVIPVSAVNYPTLTAPYTIMDMLIESTAANTGSLIDNGNLTIKGSVSVERYMTQGKYHYVSSSVSDATYSVLQSENNSDDDFFGFNTTDNIWEDLNDGEPAATPLEAGLGYAVQYAGTGSVIKTFSGSNFNTGNVSYDVTAASGGFNLVGNPYPSAINGSVFISTNSSTITGAVYLWNYDNNDYATITQSTNTAAGSGSIPDNNIGSGQAFFVEVESSDDVDFRDNMRVHDNNQFYKEEEDIQRIWLNVSDQNNSNQIAFSFQNDATEKYDRMLDAYKMQGNDALSFYSVIDNEQFVIQALPNIDKDFAIPLGLYSYEVSEYTISLFHVENISADRIILEDSYLNKMINFSENGSYSFAIEDGEWNNRFLLHIKKSVGIEEQVPENISIYSYKDVLHVSGLDKQESYQLSVYNILGQPIYEKNISSANRFSTTILAKGIFVIEIISDKYKITEKVIFNR